jgi:hypothetical protein
VRKLKGPTLKFPPLVTDLFYDLRDRRLLPLIAVLAVAIVAAPFLLGGGSKQEPPPASPPAGAVASSISGAAGSAQLTVVQAEPGLRDYRKRLGGRPARNPFKQRYTGPVLKGAHLNSQTTSATTSTTTTSSSGAGVTSPTSTSPTSGTPASTAPSSGGDSPPSGGKDQTTGTAVSSYTVDVRIVHDGKTQTRKNLAEMTKLPGDKVPAVMFMGASGDGKKALLLVSSDVNSIFGDAKCSLGSQTCDLLAVEPGFPETFVYGPNDAKYKITVLKIEPVVGGRS